MAAQATPPDLDLTRRDGLPDALRVLSEAYPRQTWRGHENFNEMIRFWVDRHMMFRQLSEILRKDVERYLDGETAFDDYAPRLSHYGATLLNELHGHHHIEDHHYFPRLIQLDARLEKGFDLLEADHGAMDGLLHEMAEGANMVLEGGANGAAAGPFLERLQRFSGLLERHLTDEEEIVVPVVLHTGFRG
ncbi:hemerythrin domain-containing protein [Sulfitobacter sabulilitoris]|uniref:Hemerythrin domain-containing protein n=1 Tax=Sulfitobacter sabulilitoris TaxID=2562655 RepID=A0A5S3PHS6_9RHOB|nr:hemerythrin domain-containing protein [Sulfitobacter sabulilitoris]TMM51334.1 hemerythrin domain-containing protein [Sulfitobacter sabulilitoris]